MHGGGFDEGTIRLLVLQPTAYCNIDCSYCYLPHRDSRSRMSPAVLDAVFGKVLRSRLVGDLLSVVWHAGEPLALPTAWYEDAFARAAAHCPPGLSLTHGFQSNGIGLDESWVALLRRHDARMGLSLDGPQDLHDAHRHDRRGRGTFALTMRGLAALREGGVDFHVITVLTRRHLEEPDRLFDFYVENGIRNVAFNVEEIEGANRVSSLAQPDAEAAMRRFLARFLDRMARAPGRVILREATGAALAIATGDCASASDQARPLTILSVGVDGRVSSFSPELLGCTAPEHGDFVFGDILADDLEAIARRVAGSRLAAEIARGVAACRVSCEHFEFCGGGAPANKWFETGRFDSTETMFCRLTRKAVVDTVLERLEAMAGVA